MSMNPFPLPEDLPPPIDDGAASHLQGRRFPQLLLDATDGSRIDLATIPGRSVIYIYPMTGRPGVPLPKGWLGIPGAPGCTSQSCSFRDHHSELQALNARVFGLSAQDTEQQKEARERLHLPFELLSDSRHRLKELLDLPSFNVDGLELYKRLTLVIEDGFIQKAFYPVFPPDLNVVEVITWLKHRAPPGVAGHAPGVAPA